MSEDLLPPEEPTAPPEAPKLRPWGVSTDGHLTLGALLITPLPAGIAPAFAEALNQSPVDIKVHVLNALLATVNA